MNNSIVKKTREAYYVSPLGLIKIEAEGNNITRLEFKDDTPGIIEPAYNGNYPGVLAECMLQLSEYFMGKREVFDIGISLEGTAFRKRVWQNLLCIPYGETRSYGDIASAIGAPKASRAVGGANHHNPISIIVPCHRVVGANGNLTGYGGKLWRKEWLIDHEKGRAPKIHRFN